MNSVGTNLFLDPFVDDDGATLVGGKIVTKAAYRAYKARRGPTGHGGMQGVGPCQLTWYEKQDRADRLGGCWIAKYNIRVAFEDLAMLISEFGERHGLARYNGTGSAADRYAQQVLDRQRKWHRIITAGG